jgi:hypothetical protein
MADTLEGRKAFADIDQLVGLTRERWLMQEEHRTSEDWWLHIKHFCNINRQWDATTQWLIFNYYGPTVNNHNSWMAPIIGRFFNKPAVLQYMSIPDCTGLEELQDYWRPLVNWVKDLDAYPMFEVFNHNAPHPMPGNVSGQFEHLLRALLLNRNRFEDAVGASYSAETTAKVLELLPHIGTNLAAEIVQDLYYMPLSKGYKDKEEYYIPSKFTKYGLSLIHLRDPKILLPYDEAKNEVRVITKRLKEEVSPDINDWMAGRALSHYYQYYMLVTTEGNGIRDYVPGRAVDLTVPFTPEDI